LNVDPALPARILVEMHPGVQRRGRRWCLRPASPYVAVDLNVRVEVEVLVKVMTGDSGADGRATTRSPRNRSGGIETAAAHMRRCR